MKIVVVDDEILALEDLVDNIKKHNTNTTNFFIIHL